MGTPKAKTAGEGGVFSKAATENKSLPVGLLDLILHAPPEKLVAIARIVGWKGNGANQQTERAMDEGRRARGAKGKSRSRGGRLGRLRHGAGYKRIWLRGQSYDLTRWLKARACIKYLVTQEAVDEDSACHLEREIDPAVRARCRLPSLKHAGELRIQHYFNDRKGRLTELRHQLIKAAGRNGYFYLAVL